MSAANWVSCMPEDDVESFTERSDERSHVFEDAATRLSTAKLSPLVWAFLQVGDLEMVKMTTQNNVSWNASQRVRIQHWRRANARSLQHSSTARHPHLSEPRRRQEPGQGSHLGALSAALIVTASLLSSVKRGIMAFVWSRGLVQSTRARSTHGVPLEERTRNEWAAFGRSYRCSGPRIRLILGMASHFETTGRRNLKEPRIC